MRAEGGGSSYPDVASGVNAPSPESRTARSESPSVSAPYESLPAGPSRDAAAHLGLSLWRSPSGRGTFHYTDVKGYRVTAGLPRSAATHRVALHEEFAAACRRDGLKPLHFGLTDAALEFIASAPFDAPRARWHVGDLPVFELARWREDATVPASIRAQARRAGRRGVTVRHWPTPSSGQLPEDVKACAPAPNGEALRRARDEWLRAKPLPPLLFMTTPHLFDPWPSEGVFVAEARGRIVGFLVASRALFGEMLRVDAVARVPGAPNGTAELLVREAFGRAAAHGIRRATLGLAPLSRRSNGRVRGWLRAVSWCARRLGCPLYSFAGLEAFKAKFEPDAWVPLYAVSPGARFTPREVLAIARAFAGGSLVRYGRAALRQAFSRIQSSRSVRSSAGSRDSGGAAGCC